MAQADSGLSHRSAEDNLCDPLNLYAPPFTRSLTGEQNLLLKAKIKLHSPCSSLSRLSEELLAVAPRSDKGQDGNPLGKVPLGQRKRHQDQGMMGGGRQPFSKG